MGLVKTLFLLLSFLLPTLVYAQTTAELEDFNAAYLQYGNTVDTNPVVAREAAKRALDSGRSLFGEDNERTAMLAINYANLLEGEPAQLYLNEAVAIYQSKFGEGAQEMIRPYMRLGRMLTRNSKWELARDYYLKARSLAESHIGADSIAVGNIQLELGSIEFSRGEDEAALVFLAAAQNALQGESEIAALNNFARVNLLFGRIYLYQERYQMALDSLLVSLDALSAYPNSNISLSNRLYLIEAYEKLGRSEDATEHLLAIGEANRLAPNENLVPLYLVVPDLGSAPGTQNNDSGILVSFTVDREGFVRQAKLINDVASDSLSAIFLQAIRQFRFAPRFIMGEAVDSPDQQYLFSY
jgi:tetratricopeptide (TPR) repeat protein